METTSIQALKKLGELNGGQLKIMFYIIEQAAIWNYIIIEHPESIAKKNNVSTQTVRKALKAMELDGIIKKKNNVIIVDKKEVKFHHH